MKNLRSLEKRILTEDTNGYVKNRNNDDSYYDGLKNECLLVATKG